MDLIEFDKKFYHYGKMIAGADEAGRGPLAGPVCAAVCILPQDFYINGINDSKKISEKRKKELFLEIQYNAVDYAYTFIDNDIIDDINILNATKLALEESLKKLKIKPDFLLTDYINNFKTVYPSENIVKGDGLSYSIAAASIIAKVKRDEYMLEMDKVYPQYGFYRHKGYGTKLHIEALKKYGPSPIHRKTFIKNFLDIK